MLTEAGGQIFIDLTGENHLHDLHDVLVVHPLSLLKLYVQIHLIQHGVDPLAAPVDDDDIDSY